MIGSYFPGVQFGHEFQHRGNSSICALKIHTATEASLTFWIEDRNKAPAKPGFMFELLPDRKTLLGALLICTRS